MNLDKEKTTAPVSPVRADEGQPIQKNNILIIANNPAPRNCKEGFVE